jgi:hypothetical protein
MNHVPDELLSALIDGEDLPADHAAHLAGCETCQGRVAMLRGVVAAVATPVTMPPAHVREAAVAAALVETSGAVPAIRRLVPRRERGLHARTSRRMSTLSAAAVFIVAVGVGGWVLSQIDTNRRDNAANTQTALRKADNDQTNVPSAAADSAQELFSSAAPAPGGGAAGTSLAGFYDAGAIGSFTEIAPIVEKYQQYSPAPTDARSTTPPQCPIPAGQTLEWHATLTYRGEAAFARVVTTPESVRTLQVLRRMDCVLLENQVLEPSTPR